MTRQLITLFSVLFFLVLAGTLSIGVSNTRIYWQEQMASHAQDAANSLALSLTPAVTDKDVPLMEVMVNGIFENGSYRDLVIDSADGEALIQRKLEVKVEGVPDWFIQMLPLESPWGEAEITTDLYQAAVLRMRSHPVHAYRGLWRNTVEIFWWFVSGSALIIVAIVVYCRRWRRPLTDIENQVLAICDRDFVVNENIPTTHDLQRLTETMNRLSIRVKSMLAKTTEKAEQMHRQAHQDSITLLDNRRSFDSRLQALMDSEEEFLQGALFLVELQYLQELNDKQGYTKGDDLLRHVADILRTTGSSLGALLLARIGGRTFAVVVEGNSAPKIDQVATILCNELAKLHARGLTPDSGIVSIGISCYSGEQSISKLLQQADSALRESRQRGANKWAIHDNVNNQGVYGTQAWIRILRDVIEQQKIVLQFQPVRHVARESVYHYEVLARIVAPDNGELIPAGVFFSLAERFDLSIELDQCIIEASLAHLMAHPEVCYAVNLSARSLENRAFHHWLFEQFSSRPDVATRISVEVSERIVLNAYEHTLKLQGLLNRLGVKFGVDYFGGNSSGFGYLSTLTPDYIKLDGSYSTKLESHPGNQFFISSVADVANRLDIDLVVQRVESIAAWHAACDLKIDAGQGNYLGRPEFNLSH